IAETLSRLLHVQVAAQSQHYNALEPAPLLRRQRDAERHANLYRPVEVRDPAHAFIADRASSVWIGAHGQRVGDRWSDGQDLSWCVALIADDDPSLRKDIGERSLIPLRRF